MIEITSSPRKPSYKNTEGPPTVAFPIPGHPAPLGLRSLLPELKTPQARLDWLGVYFSWALRLRCQRSKMRVNGCYPAMPGTFYRRNDPHSQTEATVQQRLQTTCCTIKKVGF